MQSYPLQEGRFATVQDKMDEDEKRQQLMELFKNHIQ